MRWFEYLLYRAFSLSLLVVLVLLPLAPAFASEVEEVSTEEPSAEVVVEALEDENIIEEDVQPDVVLLSEPEQIENNEVAVEQIVDTNDVQQPISDSTQSEGVTDSSDVVSVPEETNAQEDTEPQIEDAVVSTDEGAETEATTTEEVLGTSTTTPDILPVPEDDVTPTDELPTEEESTTTPELLLPEEMQTGLITIPVTDENRFSFSKSECVQVSDGSFYCKSATATPTVIGNDRVFSAPDSDGDREIYIEKSGEITQITFNELDDDAPYYDEQSDTIVWHRLVHERYQIIVFDLDSEEETQITHDRYNNMEPSRDGDLTVWQGWVGSDWEIMLLEGDDIVMVTDNTTEDIAPRINDNYIIWQAFEGNAWHVKVYDRLTKSIDTIEDADGASLANPRFVLVYDTEHENGDVETKGYDLRTGEVTPLGAVPAPIPENIPNPEQTGEERALVQTITQIKTKTETEGEPDIDIVPETNTPTGDEIASTTPTLAEDVIIPPFDDISTSTTPEISDVSTGELPEMNDVIIPAIEENDATSTEHIPDVILTPYTEPIE